MCLVSQPHTFFPALTFPFVGSITAILVSRFLLQLQEANQSTVRVDAEDPGQSSRDPYDTVSFISSLGAFINPDLSAVTSPDDDSEVHVDSNPTNSEKEKEKGGETEVNELTFEAPGEAAGSSPSSA